MAKKYTSFFKRATNETHSNEDKKAYCQEISQKRRLCLCPKGCVIKMACGLRRRRTFDTRNFFGFFKLGFNSNDHERFFRIYERFFSEFSQKTCFCLLWRILKNGPILGRSWFALVWRYFWYTKSLKSKFFFVKMKHNSHEID